MTVRSSKYLIPNRLEDVLACIQMFASERSGKHEISIWAVRFGRGPSSAESKGLTHTTSNSEHRETRAWKQVLEEHSEFFIIETDADGKERASLLMRRAYDRVYDSYQNKELTAKEIDDLRFGWQTTLAGGKRQAKSAKAVISRANSNVDDSRNRATRQGDSAKSRGALTILATGPRALWT